MAADLLQAVVQGLQESMSGDAESGAGDACQLSLAEAPADTRFKSSPRLFNFRCLFGWQVGEIVRVELGRDEALHLPEHLSWWLPTQIAIAHNITSAKADRAKLLK